MSILQEAVSARSNSTAQRRPVDLDYAQVPVGVVNVIPERCKGCRYCVEFCPQGVLTESADINAKGYHYPVVAEGREADCVNCGFCNLVCPEMAIFAEEGTRVLVAADGHAEYDYGD